MAGNNNTIDTYQNGYTLVEDNTEYEYRSTWYFHGALPIESRWYRKFETKTYEATLTEYLTGEGVPSAYNHDANIPTESNAKTLIGDLAIQGADWKLQSIEYTKSLSTPLSRDIRITYIKQGNWVHIDASSSM